MGGQIGWKTESVWGTPVTVDQFVPCLSSRLTIDEGYMRPEGIRAGRRTLAPGGLGAGSGRPDKRPPDPGAGEQDDQGDAHRGAEGTAGRAKGDRLSALTFTAAAEVNCKRVLLYRHVGLEPGEKVTVNRRGQYEVIDICRGRAILG